MNAPHRFDFLSVHHVQVHPLSNYGFNKFIDDDDGRYSLVVLTEGIRLDGHIVVLVETLPGPVVRVLPVRVVFVEATFERHVLTLPGIHRLIGIGTQDQYRYHSQHQPQGSCNEREEKERHLVKDGGKTGQCVRKTPT